MFVQSIAKQTLSLETRLKIIGGRPLEGKTTIDGSKNSVLPLLAATTLIGEGWATLKNVPAITDTDVMIEILHELGMESKRQGSTVKVCGELKNGKVSKYLASKIRASLLFLGPLIALLGEAEIPIPGGDMIGDRPVDLHVDALAALGVETTIQGGYIYAKATRFPLIGGRVYLAFPSVGATQNVLMAAALAEGVTVIENAAREPEVIDLVHMLNKMGANIKGAGTSTLHVKGTDKKLRGVEHEVIPDRLEAGTILAAMVMTGGEGIIKGVVPAHNRSLLSLLNQIGVRLHIRKDGIVEVLRSTLTHPIRVTAMPYPGLPTDLQPIITSLATKAPGESIISDIVFKERFAHVYELRKMGANISQSSNIVRVHGGTPLTGSNVYGNDIRSITSLVCAGLAAKDATYVHGIEHLHRGHGNLIQKLTDLNAVIEYQNY
ncbi:UDP-N-acetylglucosamine 1-carboxyvinyltransferase [Tumebacillus lipolyticus]|uniref:UDP-N-acetylglucosamine 1-carboxyvinyltransferase n=1 Tax=Tumebacillus lipolyticus TaxID=1280370 RepID=A0ABW4ZXL6_9BACL